MNFKAQRWGPESITFPVVGGLWQVKCSRSEVMWFPSLALKRPCSSTFILLECWPGPMNQGAPANINHRCVSEAVSCLSAQPTLQLNATVWVTPSKVSRKIVQPTHRILRNNSHCHFKPLSFGVISYTEVVNWNKNKGDPNSAHVQYVTILLLKKHLSRVRGGNASFFIAALRNLKKSQVSVSGI